MFGFVPWPLLGIIIHIATKMWPSDKANNFIKVAIKHLRGAHYAKPYKHDAIRMHLMHTIHI